MREGATTCVAVTGANGHLARAILTRLEAAGVAAIELSSSAAGRQRRFRLEDERPEAALEGADTVIHTAWDLTARSKARITALNVAGSQRLIDAARRRGAHVVFVSSMAAYAGTSSAYGAGKREVEDLVAEAGGTSVRPGLIFGPSVGGMFGSLRAVVESRRIVPVIHSPGRLQLVHVADLADLIVDLALRPPADRSPIAAAHPAPRSLDEVVSTIGRALDRRVLRVPVPWRVVHTALRAAERAGAGTPFGSDSVISLARAPVAEIASATAARLRPFDERTVLQS